MPHPFLVACYRPSKNVIMKSKLSLIVNSMILARYPQQIRRFRKYVGYMPNVAFPSKYHELMLWRKIFDHNPLFAIFSDKLAAKEYVADMIPEAKVPKTLWVGEDIRELPKDLRMSDAVLKANHGSGFNYFGALGSIDDKTLYAMTRKWLRKNHGKKQMEWAYFNVRPRLFLEQRLRPSADRQLVDLFIRCSNGIPILASAAINNKTPQQRSGYFNLNGSRENRLNSVFSEDKQLPTDFLLPESFARAIEYAKRLSIGVDYARYDFLSVDNDIYPGEITVYPGAGLSKASPSGLDKIVMDHWDISSCWFLKQPWRGWKGEYADALRGHFRSLKFGA